MKIVHLTPGEREAAALVAEEIERLLGTASGSP
jgi:hypothetical protein